MAQIIAYNQVVTPDGGLQIKIENDIAIITVSNAFMGSMKYYVEKSFDLEAFEQFKEIAIFMDNNYKKEKDREVVGDTDLEQIF